jgi:MFS superfamily sulfate permease-like transporter
MTATKTKSKTDTSFCSGTRARMVATARDVAAKVPDAAETVKSTAVDAYRMVDTMPRSQRKQLTTISLAVGALLFLFGAPRLLSLLAFIPALAVAGTKVAHRAASEG